MKYCGKCNQILSQDNFRIRIYKNKKVLYSYCKICERKYAKQHSIQYRLLNLNKIRESRRNQRRKSYEFLKEYKESRPCIDCKKFYPHYVMDFDHLFNKKKGISLMRTQGSSIEEIKKEIQKCELVCANCHRQRTWNRLGVG